MEVVVGETGYGENLPPPVKRILAVNWVTDGNTKSRKILILGGIRICDPVGCVARCSNIY
jgi:hypothetical protein